MKITIDPDADFCSGVRKAIEKAEKVLEKESQLYCLGDIVHNEEEIRRLKERGLEIINYEVFKKLRNCKVLIRAHGEPPETYQIAGKNNIELIDTSCPIVLSVQKNILNKYSDPDFNDHQFVIFGKKDHPEVRGLNGQIGNNAIVISESDDLTYLDPSKPVILYTQTTKSKKGFKNIRKEIKKLLKGNKNGKTPEIITCNTLCKQVSNRDEKLISFAENHDVIIFVSGKKSSNGLYLYNVCKSVNPNSYMVSGKEEVEDNWFKTVESIGVSGATSTPKWLLENVASQITALTENL